MLNIINSMFQGKVYACGGSVRDELLNITPKDYDYTTPMLPDDIEQVIRDVGKRPYLTGKRFGTIGFKLDGKFIEVTSFRHERYIEGSRKPEVEFVKDINEDLSRRDFTINAMAKCVDGTIIDPFCGRLDLITKTIRCVGKPKDRFNEDPLRILRAARFAGQLGFKIDEQTLTYMGKMVPKLMSVSKERWCMELDKLLVSDFVMEGLDYLMESRVFNFIIPELSLQYHYDQNSIYHNFDLWEHTKRVVNNSPKELYVRWAALLHDIAKPFVRTMNKHGKLNYIDHAELGSEMVEKLGRYLKRSNEWITNVKKLVAEHMEEFNPLRLADDVSK